ncbi:putative ribonuclease H-like domain-containing protein [Tanacetum coccineum]
MDHPKVLVIGDITSATQQVRLPILHNKMLCTARELLQFYNLSKGLDTVGTSKMQEGNGTKWCNRNKKEERGIVVRKPRQDRLHKMMHKRFQMSSMGELTFFLGLQVLQKDDGIFISQDKYVADILKKFDFVTYPMDSPFDLEAFSDSDYAGASLDRKSTTGGCQFLGKRLISWQCKKQTIVANSTTEAEYVATANCCGQVLWIQNQMLDYGFNFMNTKIHIDNESTICIVKNPVFHSKTKHIEIRHHFIRDSYEKKLIQVIKIHTDHNVADLLTKAFDVVGVGRQMERAATTASSLEAEPRQGSGHRCQDTILVGAEAQIRLEAASKQSNDPPLS